MLLGSGLWFLILGILCYGGSEYYHVKNQIESEQVSTGEGQLSHFFRDLPKEEQETQLKDHLKKYCQKVKLVPHSFWLVDIGNCILNDYSDSSILTGFL